MTTCCMVNRPLLQQHNTKDLVTTNKTEQIHLKGKRRTFDFIFSVVISAARMVYTFSVLTTHAGKEDFLLCDHIGGLLLINWELSEVKSKLKWRGLSQHSNNFILNVLFFFHNCWKSKS